MKRTNNPGIDNKRIILQYSMLFCVFAVGIFFALIISQRSFMQFHDAYTQGVFRLIELRNQVRSIISGEGFSFWSWYEGPGTDESLENFIEIGSLAGALFPEKYIELGLTFAALVRMYLGGIAFILLGKEVNLNYKQKLIGALLYVFSACFIGMAIRQSEMLLNAYLFPLLVMTAERVYKEKSPLPFIFVVAYYTAVAIYNAYMSAIVIVMYILIRYFYYHEKIQTKDYAISIAKFFSYGILGIFLSAITSIFSIATIQRASADSSLDSVGILFGTDQYAIFGKMFLGSAATYDYLDIGIPVLIIMLLPVAVSKCTRKKTNVIMFITLFVMMMFPFFNSMFNGFGYVSFRWSYMFLLFAVWSGIEQFAADTFKEKRNIIFAAAGLVVIVLWAVVPHLIGLASIGLSGKFFWLVEFAAGLALIPVFFYIRKKDEINIKATIAVLLISLISLSLGWSAGFYGNRNNFAKAGTVMNNLESSTLRVSNQIEDNGFYRVDSVDGINRHSELRFPANENIWWKANNLFIYNSRIPETLTEFNVDTGNSYGYARRVYVLSNGNRMGLDFIYGVRYFLGNDTKKEGYENSDNYAGYGFELKETLDGVNVFKNKYDVGLGFVCRKVIAESEFDKLDSLYKEQAMMQAVVIPDESLDSIQDAKLVGSDELEYDVKDIPYEIIECDGLTVQDGRIETEKEEASFTIVAKDIPDCQLMVSFDNLLRNSKDGKKGSSFDVYASDGKVNREAFVTKSRQGVANLMNHDLNMGHYSGNAEIKIGLVGQGTYTFDGIHLYAMSTALYDKHATELMTHNLKITDYDDKKAVGTVESGEGGILFLSIPVHDSWDVYIDGTKADIIKDVNVTFAGVYVPPGVHDIMLDYDNNYIKIGSIISLLVLIVISTLIIKERKNRRTDGK